MDERRLFHASAGLGDAWGKRLILMLEGFSKLGWSGLTIVGILVFREPATVARMFFAAVLLVGIVGLKLTSAS